MRAEPLDFLRERGHPQPGLFRQLGGLQKTLIDGHQPGPGHQVVGMRNDLLFDRLRHTVAGVKPQCDTFIGREPGTRVAFHNPDNIFRESFVAQQVRTGLGMSNRMRHAPTDIMKHGAGLDKSDVGTLTAPGIRECAVTDCLAVVNDLPAAPGRAQQVFIGFGSRIRHARVIS